RSDDLRRDFPGRAFGGAGFGRPAQESEAASRPAGLALAAPAPLRLPKAGAARAGLALGGVAGGTRGDAIRVGNAELILFQPPDFIAQARGFLKLKVGGGF